MNNVCLIPARGGSKRIPNKNIKEFYNISIINFPITYASSSNLFDKIVISTDSEIIKDTILNTFTVVDKSIEVFDRSKETSTDEAMLADVIIEYLLQCGETIDSLCCLLPCTPLLNENNLIDAYKLFKPGVDSVVPIVQYSQPYKRALIKKNDKVQMIDDKYYNVRSQDLEPIYYDPGQFWILNPISFILHKKLYMPNSVPYEMSEADTQDVDTFEDWAMLELKYKRKHG